MVMSTTRNSSCCSITTSLRTLWNRFSTFFSPARRSTPSGSPISLILFIGGSRKSGSAFSICPCFPTRSGAQAIRDAATEFKPDLVCFSWRDIQIFSPHEGDSSLEHAFNFYFRQQPAQARCRLVRRGEAALSLLQPYPRDPLVSLVDPQGVPQGADHDRRRSLYRVCRSADPETSGRHHRHSWRRGRRDSQSHRRPVARERTLYRSGREDRFGRASKARRRCSMP